MNKNKEKLKPLNQVIKERLEKTKDQKRRDTLLMIRENFGVRFS